MSPPFRAFSADVWAAAPRSAIVLGSGLADATAAATERASVPYTDVPGVARTTVHGHRGRLVLARWNGVPALIAFGRQHSYEGHSTATVTALVRTLAALGVRHLILTNAAGGIHDSLAPGTLMPLRGHRKLLGPNAWREWATSPPVMPYSLAALERLRSHERAAGRSGFDGVYAALTGPSYETIAEVRALQRGGIDAVGMSTALEAEAAVALGLDVTAISCITNRAAGLGDGPLDHQEVLVNARLALERLGEWLELLLEA